MNLLEQIRSRFAAAAPEGADADAFAQSVRPSNDAKFGDYQANGCMALKKVLNQPPRTIAEGIAQAVDLKPIAPAPEVAGPGFLNIRICDDWLSAQLDGLLEDPQLGVPAPASTLTVVVDYSSPNVAKPMHVGHIRSTVIGDALANIYQALGHRVIRDNHLGDWGTQFGMILHGYKTIRDDATYQADPVGELARLYRAVSAATREDPQVAEAARVETSKLHAGDLENRRLWDEFMPHCLQVLDQIYQRLDVRFDTYHGESHYNAMLPEVVEALERTELAEPSEGATVVFTETSKAPFIVRKTDGAYTYATTDLATIQFRLHEYEPDLCLYVVDTRQGDHFRQLFEVAERWGKTGQARLVHVNFGTIMGPDRRPYKTRSGDVVGLESLLDDAVEAARRVVDEKSGDLPVEDRAQIAEVVGIGAIKYADLNQNRESDYVFDLDKFVALEGNTATYLQYAYARVQSIFRKGEVDPESIRRAHPAIYLTNPAERALALAILRFPETLQAVTLDFKPNVLTEFLFWLANHFSTFFLECPVLKADSPERKESRLALCDLTARVLERGLGLLGIRVLDRM